MNITRIDVIRLAVPFSSGREDGVSTAPPGGDEAAFNAASPQLKQMETLLVKVTTEDGLSGWGEAFGHLINPVTFAALAGPVGRFFLGKPAEDIAALRAEAEYAFHAFGRTGPVTYALSAIDTALWDLSAQRAGEPLYRHLGGTRGTIDLYASLVSYGNVPTEVARQVRRVAALGFRQIKLHETEYAAIAAAREALPADVGLMVDVNCPWPVSEAIARATALRELNLGWLEEPVWPPDDVAGLAVVRATGVRVSAGENASGVAALRSHFEHGALDVVQPSVAKIGGVSAMREVFALAAAHEVKVVPHCFYYGAGLLATAHLVATLPADIALEVPFIQFTPMLHPSLAFAPTLTLPDTPGLGFEPDPEVLSAYCIDRVTLQ
jgi:L-alanine-DL-glutamate epimerase-like enolase superfamily enzyme